jgi:hypothetical protein
MQEYSDNGNGLIARQYIFERTLGRYISSPYMKYTLYLSRFFDSCPLAGLR